MFRSTSPNYNPVAFELFIDWLYRGSIKKIPVDLETSAGVSNRSHILDLCCIAEAWDLLDLENLVTDRMRTWKWTPSCFSVAAIQKIYVSTLAKSPLRRILVDHFLYAIVSCVGERLTSHIEVHLRNGNNLFVADCFEATYAAYAKTKLRDPQKRPKCAYHVHKDGRSCDK